MMGIRNEKPIDINSMLTDEYCKRDIQLIKHDTMNARKHSKMSGLHLHRKGKDLLIEILLFNLNSFCRDW